MNGKIINVTKVFNLDENFKFPTCHVCGKELTPFSVTREELDTLSFDTNEILIGSGLVKLNEISKDKHLIYLCKHCLTMEKSC